MSCGTVRFFMIKCLLILVLFSSIVVNGFLADSKRKALKTHFVDYQISGYVNHSIKIPRTPDVSPDLRREEAMLQTKRILNNNATIKKDLVTKNTSSESVSHIPDDCDPFINENGCLSIIQKDDVYIKIIDTDSKRGRKNQYYKRVDKPSRNSKRKRKKSRKNKRRKKRKNKNKNNQGSNSSVNSTLGKIQCQTGNRKTGTNSEKCSENTDLNPNSNLDSKLSKKYWTVPKFVLALRQKLIQKIKQLYGILRNGVGETIRNILHSYMQIHDRYKDIKENSRNVLIAGHEAIIDIIQISEQIYETISSLNEFTRRLYSRKLKKVLPQYLRVNHHFAVIKSRNRHTHVWETLKILQKTKTFKNKIILINRFSDTYDYNHFYEKVYLLKEHTFNQRTRLINLLDISRHVNYTMMRYPHLAKLSSTRDISTMNRNLMDEHYNIKSRIRIVNQNLNNIRMLQTSCWLKMQYLSGIDFSAVIKSRAEKRKPLTEIQKQQVRKWASQVKEHITDIDDVMEIIHRELQPLLRFGKNIIWRLKGGKQNDKNNDRLERLRKKVHYWSYLKRFSSNKQKDGMIGDDGAGGAGANKWNTWGQKKRNFFKNIRSRLRREAMNADQDKGSDDSYEDIEQKLREVIKKLDEVWANILKFINTKNVCENGEDLGEGSGNLDHICKLNGSNEDREDLTTSNKNVDEDEFEFVDSSGIIPVSSKRLLKSYLNYVIDKGEKVKSRSYDVQQNIEDLKPELARISSELSRTEKLSNSTNFLQKHILEFLSNRSKYITEMKETTAELELILTKVNTMTKLAEKVLADEDNLRKLLEERKKAKEKQIEEEKKEKEGEKAEKKKRAEALKKKRTEALKKKSEALKKKKLKAKKNKRQRDTHESLGGKRNSKKSTTDEDDDDDNDGGGGGNDNGGVGGSDDDEMVSRRRNKEKNRKESDKIKKGMKKKESESDISFGDGKKLDSRGNRGTIDKHSSRNRHTMIVNGQDKKINGQRKGENSDVRGREDEVEEEDKRVKKRKKDSKRKSDIKKKQVVVKMKNENVENKKEQKKDEKEGNRRSGSENNNSENWLDVWEDLLSFEDLIKENGSQKLLSGEMSRNNYNISVHEGKTTIEENNGRKKIFVLKENDGSNEKKHSKGTNERNKDIKGKKKKSKNGRESKKKRDSENPKKRNWLDFWENLLESEELMTGIGGHEAGSEDVNRNKDEFQNEQNVAKVKDVGEKVAVSKNYKGNFEKKQDQEEDEEIKNVEKKNGKSVDNVVVNIKKQKNSKGQTKKDQESRKNKLKLKIKRVKRYRRDLGNIQNDNNSFDRKRDTRRRRRQMRRKKKRKLHINGGKRVRWQSDEAEDDAVIKFVLKTNEQIEIYVAKSKQKIDVINKTLQELPRNLHQSVINNVQQLRLNISQIQHKIQLARTLLSAMKIPVKFTGKNYLKVPLHFGYNSRKIQSAMDVCVKPKVKSGSILGVKVNNSVSYILGLNNRAVFLSVYDIDGNELERIESKIITKPDVWYKFGIQRIGRNFSMIINPISTESKKEVVKIFLPKINAEHISPSVAYIGGYPEELWKNKLKQLEGCVGSLDVDGHAMTLMQPFSDGSQPIPCTHGCGDNSSMVFEGNGFAELQADNILKIGLTSVQLSFKTYQTDSLLLFLKSTNFLLIITLESGNIRIQYELEDSQTAKLSGPTKLSNGILHKLQVSIKNGKFSAGIVNEKLKFSNTVSRSEHSELKTGFSLGGLSPHYQNSSVSQYRSLTGCLSNVRLNHEEVSLLQLQDLRHVQLGNCDDNLWISCVQFTKNSKPIHLPDFEFVKSISIKVSHQANGVALFFQRKEKFAIGVNLQDSLVEVINHDTEDRFKMYRNSSTALWNVITVDDQVGNLHISLDGESSVDMSYEKNTGNWFNNNENDFSMSITVGGLSKQYQQSSNKLETLYGSISTVLIENILVDLRRAGASNQMDVCSKLVEA